MNPADHGHHLGVREPVLAFGRHRFVAICRQQQRLHERTRQRLAGHDGRLPTGPAPQGGFTVVQAITRLLLLRTVALDTFPLEDRPNRLLEDIRDST
jgi:hypothetical protein